MILLRSLLFNTLMILSVLPYAVAVLLAAPFGGRATYRLVAGWVDLNVWFLRRICSLDYEVRGRENIPAEASVAMLKHSSAYETLVELQIFPRQTWVLKRELLWVPFFGWALATLQPIAIDRRAGGSAVQQVIDQGKRRLADGIWVMVFPEGTRMAPGETRRYGLSGTLLAQAAGRKLVPVAHDAGYYWPRRGLRKRPGTVRFVIGEPVDPAGRDPREVNEEIQAWVEATIAELRAEAER
ncbi:MAG: 1-acyl-sn-glycerol-3-phosphate acyltransferase [Gammaproteobacteria bacterium]|nr:MAG: 1-acyl-sn-glycerol-3-phosphate acyltransferase [Gammaproteobacteria bacterium]